MANKELVSPVVEYLHNNKDLGRIEELNEIDKFILSILSYTKFEFLGSEIKPPLTIREYAKYYPPNDTTKDGIYLKFLIALANNDRYADIKIIDFQKKTSIENEMQYAFMAFSLPNKHIFVSYRGTDASVVGWKENLNMAYLSTVPAQDEAHNTLDYLMSRHPLAKFDIGGHSKGGALAVYAFSKLSPLRLRRVESVTDLDSPGLRNDDMTREMIQKIHAYIPKDAVVGLIYRKRQKVSVVASINKGIMQHDAFSWDIEGDKLKRLDEFATGIVLEESELNKLLANLSPWEAEYFVNMVYELLDTSNTESVDNLFRIKVLIEAYKKYKTLDPDNSLVFKDIMKRLIKSIFK